MFNKLAMAATRFDLSQLAANSHMEKRSCVFENQSKLMLNQAPPLLELHYMTLCNNISHFSLTHNIIYLAMDVLY